MICLISHIIVYYMLSVPAPWRPASGPRSAPSWASSPGPGSPRRRALFYCLHVDVMCVCMCVYVCVCIYIYIYIYIHTYIHTHTYTYTSIYIYIYIYIFFIYIYIYCCVYVYAVYLICDYDNLLFVWFCYYLIHESRKSLKSA